MSGVTVCSPSHHHRRYLCQHRQCMYRLQHCLDSGVSYASIYDFDLYFCATYSWILRRESSGYTLLLLRRCVKSFSALFAANTVAHVHRRRGCVAVFMTCHVYSADQLCALNREVAATARPICRTLCTGA